MEYKTLEKNLEEVRSEMKETHWAARYRSDVMAGVLNYQKKCLGRVLDRAKYDIRKYR